jgi:polyisoprenoid-binding protein YceI
MREQTRIPLKAATMPPIRRSVAAVTALTVTLLAAGYALAGQRYTPDLGSSTVRVEGSSNVHDWHAESPKILGSLTLEDESGKPLADLRDFADTETNPDVSVAIPAESLESGTSGLDKKMYAALETGKHPTIRYRMASAERVDGEGETVIHTAVD